MRKIVSFVVLLGCFHACSTIYYGQETPPKAEKIPEAYTPKSTSDSKVRYKLVEHGEKLIGSKYKFGGTTPKGFDCSGFTGYVYDKVAIDISRSSQSQAKIGQKIKTRDTKAGDLIFFTGTGRNKISHVAMVVSNDEKGIVVIHSTSSKGVRKDNITHSSYWKPKILFARQIVD